MGIDITSHIQRKVAGAWVTIAVRDDQNPLPYLYRSSPMFDLLSGAGRLGGPPSPFGQRGLPPDAPEEWVQYVTDQDVYGVSWLLNEELLNFNYDTPVEDRTRRDPPQTLENGTFISGGYAEPWPAGRGRMTTWRNYLEPNLTPMLAQLRALGSPAEVRLVFWFF